MSLLKFLTKQQRTEGIDVCLYLKGITEETGDLNRLIRCYEYNQYLQMPVQASANPKLSTITLTKPVDSYTPVLNLAAATNLIIPRAILYFYNNAAKQIQYMITLHDVFISSTRQYLKTDKNLCDTFTLGFDKIKWEYKSSSTGWDLSGKKPL
ncbi:type VI secretion system tube protein Hcp [Dethiobacter alkaliphilus]|uniref:Hemolysin-coregulated protein (Uncharacterized)-like protein n=1 Tax=Dethiobacter alkaliphilus AHT 1 TaxID=555088 RepID=C0GK75_DETAL|nr:type VI secretion system tube protein Hcp [Dethiobacter alkaliphilus]EEG76258.1 Hemolysin-coregulated protein (uncharacterized)-like protein [Dethiobacter alkaliphilus AHT 1]